MSRTYDRLKALETRIEHERNDRGRETEEHARAARKSAEESLSAIHNRAGRPAASGGNRGMFYLAAAALGLLAAGYTLVAPPPADTQPAAQTAPVPAIVQQPDTRLASVAASSQAQVKSQVRQAVLGWAQAWSRREVAAYLSHYARDFSPPGGLTREAWEAQRASRLGKYRSIEVALKDIEIVSVGDDEVSVHFLQDFRADGYRETGTRKELRLKNVQGRWLIVSEAAA